MDEVTESPKIEQKDNEPKTLLVRRMLLKICHDSDVNMGESLFDALDVHVREHLAKAIKRAKANGRSTLQGKDV